MKRTIDKPPFVIISHFSPFMGVLDLIYILRRVFALQCLLFALERRVFALLYYATHLLIWNTYGMYIWSNSNPESNNVTPPSVNDEASNVVDISSESSANNKEISSNNLHAFVQNNAEQNSYQDVSQTEVKGEVENFSGFTTCGFRMEKPKLP